jgi:large subunit ribosomal protein L6
MSRIGKKIITLPSNAKVSFTNKNFVVEGPKGKLELKVHDAIDLNISESEINVVISSGNEKDNSFQGMTRALINNLVTGVTSGFEKSLEVNGIGYRVEVKGKTVVLNVGYSNPSEFELPDGISAEVEKNVLKISGIDKQLVGHVASKIREIRPPEPYKGKGIKYVDEHIIKKAGKTGA